MCTCEAGAGRLGAGGVSPAWGWESGAAFELMSDVEEDEEGGEDRSRKRRLKAIAKGDAEMDRVRACPGR